MCGKGRKMACIARKEMWKRGWEGGGKVSGDMHAIPAVQSFHAGYPRSIHGCGWKNHPSVIFFLMSSRLFLNSESSFVMVSMRPQAEMAVV